VNTSGTLTEHYGYDAYGTIIVSNATPSTIYLFAGEQWDPELGLYYNRVRYLNVNLGRFWSYDTFEGNQTDSLSLHKYLYGADNPVNRIDPSGNTDISLANVLITSGIGAGIGGLSSAVANYAMGRAITFGSVLQGAAIGAVLGPGVLVPATAIGLGAGGVLVGGSFLPILTDPGASPTRKVAAASLFVASLWGAKAGFDYSKSPRFVQTPESPSPQPTITLYHKGELSGGAVSANRSLSLGIERTSVEALNRPGQVWVFELPVRLLIQWEAEGYVTRLTDTDLMTGVVNNEVRVLPPKSAEMNNFIKKN
jgi:RHS repeat-associated protein